MRIRCWPTRSTASCCPRITAFPLRALAPGWVGSTSIKWLGRIVVSSQQLWTRNNTSSYTLIGEDYPPEGEAPGKVATTQTNQERARASLAGAATRQASPASMASRTRRPARSSKWSGALDAGESWYSGAEMTAPQLQYSWARFGFIWDARPGENTIMTRATDAAGNSQPDEIPFNQKGYLFNQPPTAPDSGSVDTAPPSPACTRHFMRDIADHIKIVSVTEMQRLEKEADAAGQSYAAMMEQAGAALAGAIQDSFARSADRSVLVLAGPGNNGGDGLVCARHLSDAGFRVRVYLWKRKTGPEEDYEGHFGKLLERNVSTPQRR